MLMVISAIAMSFKLANVETIYASDPKLKKNDVKALLQWIATQPHLPKLEELQVILFLHSCCYQIEETKTTIENYFKIRSTSNLFRNVTEKLIRETLESCFIGFMPKRTPEGDAIFFIRMLDTRPEIYNCPEHSKVIIAILILYFYRFGPANGLLVVFDMRYASLGHLLRVNLSAIKQMIYFFQEAAPTRLKTVHNVFSKPLTQKFMELVKPFMKREVQDMIMFHDSLDSFYKHVPRDCFLGDYEGLLPSMKEVHATNVKNVLDNLDILSWHETQKIDENKRVRKEGGFFRNIYHKFY